jgi:hypothetical protein
MLIAVMWIQSLYFIATGLWALVDIHSFMAVTGPKEDIWLVRTVGVLVLGIGLSLLAAAWKRRAGAETMILAVGSALGLLVIDCVYVFAGVISTIYLADAAAEGLIILGLLIGKVRAGSRLHLEQE